jgi:hypothetical protein
MYAACAACGLAPIFYSAIYVRTWLNSCYFFNIYNQSEHFITRILHPIAFLGDFDHSAGKQGPVSLGLLQNETHRTIDSS